MKWTRTEWCSCCERWITHWSDGSVTFERLYPCPHEGVQEALLTEKDKP